MPPVLGRTLHGGDQDEGCEKDFINTCVEDDKTRKEVDDKLKVYQEEDAASGGKRKAGELNDGSGKRRRTLEATEEQAREYETVIGVFWPTKEYKREFNKRIPRSKRTWRDGKLGIILDSSACSRIPDGCTRIIDRSKKGLAVKTHVADNEENPEGFDKMATVALDSMKLSRKTESRENMGGKNVAFDDSLEGPVDKERSSLLADTFLDSGLTYADDFTETESSDNDEKPVQKKRCCFIFNHRHLFGQ